MKESKILNVPFCNNTIQAIEHNNNFYVSMRPICKNIGLQWGSQYNRIMRDDVIKSSVFIMKAVAEDGKCRDSVYIPLSMLNGWLFGISTKRIKPELKEKLIQYKKECYDVLFKYWHEDRPSAMKEINELIFIYNQEKEKASKSGQTLSKWKFLKKSLYPRIKTLIENNQLKLNFTA